MMKKLTTLSWIFISASALSIACAKASGGEGGDGDGDGDTVLPMSGGSTGAGGLVLGTSGGAPQGGAPGSGGLVGSGGTPVVSCMEGDMLACDEVPGNTTLLFGMASCNESGDGWDTSACTVCEADTQMIDCADIVGGAETYTGGTATCNSTGDGWDESSCEYCGDDAINGADEQCDGTDTPAETCAGLGLDPGTQGTDPLTCDAATCRYDISNCGLCDPGNFTGDKCLEGGSCGTSAACTDTQCGASTTCTFTCNYDADCTGMSCNTDAECTFVCPGSAACEFECLDGSTCSNSSQHMTSVNATCEAGADCAIQCAGGGTPCDIACASGSNCSVDAENNSAQPAGAANCASGTCDYTFNTGQSIAGLAITCETGATCNVTQLSYGANVSGVVCQSGSTCVLTPPGDGDMTYTCEDGATCTCTPGGNGSMCNCTGDGC